MRGGQGAANIHLQSRGHPGALPATTQPLPKPIARAGGTAVPSPVPPHRLGVGLADVQPQQEEGDDDHQVDQHHHHGEQQALEVVGEDARRVGGGRVPLWDTWERAPS